MIDEIGRAISDFDRAIQLEPDNAIRYYNRGIAFSRKHQVQKATDDYSRAIQLGPDLAPAYGNRAHEFELAGERDKAIADYRKALLLAPELRDVIVRYQPMIVRPSLACSAVFADFLDPASELTPV